MGSSVKLLWRCVSFLVFHFAIIQCNVDTVNYILYEGPPNSKFGYNVFMNEENDQKW